LRKLTIRLVARLSKSIDLIEAAHGGDGDLQTWTERLLSAAKSVFASSDLNLGIARRGERAYHVLSRATESSAMDGWWRKLPDLPPESFDPFVRHARYVSSVRSVAGDGPIPELARDFLDTTGVYDTLGLTAMVDDVSFALGVPHTGVIRLTTPQRHMLTQVALHIESNLRLRVRPASLVAVLRPDGRLIHAENGASTPLGQNRLARHVALVESGRSRRHRQRAESVQTWSALISGRWGLIEREERGIGRCYAVLETTRGRPLRALSELETHAVQLSARGLTGKAAAYALGVAPAAVSKLLASATLKVGLTNRTELVRLTACLLDASPARVDDGLTRAERDVLALVRLGWTNAKIASSRGRSEFTVANQVASLLEKLKLPSRRALATTR
jgi:DNA-binding NarL/FixJ family response regulator